MRWNIVLAARLLAAARSFNHLFGVSAYKQKRFACCDILSVIIGMTSSVANKKRIVECPACHRLMKAVCDLESADGDHLYVMTASNDMFPGLVKIGRSKNPCERALQLQEAQPYHIIIKAIYWGAGQKEKAVHIALAAFKVCAAPGQEWFEVPVQHACLAITRILFGDPAAPRSRRVPSDDEEVDAGE